MHLSTRRGLLQVRGEGAHFDLTPLQGQAGTVAEFSHEVHGQEAQEQARLDPLYEVSTVGAMHGR